MNWSGSEKPVEHDVPCPDCGTKMRLRPGVVSRNPWYSCPNFPQCKGSHSAHPDGRPMGTPGSVAVKKARRAAHAAFDKLHESGTMRKSDAYAWLAERMRLDRESCHIGNFNEEQCAEVVALVDEQYPSL